MKPYRVLLFFLMALPVFAADHAGEQFTRYAGFALKHSTLADVQARLGASRLHEQGDAGEYEAWICYAAKNADVHFNSGEMGGGTDLLGITLIQRSDSLSSCAKPRSVLPTSIGPVRLGQSLEEFRAAVGVPLTWSGKTATANFEYTLPGGAHPPLDVAISVLGTFRQGRVVKIQAWKIEST